MKILPDPQTGATLTTIRPELAPHVEAVRAAAARTAAGVRDLGAALADAKAECRHGEWLPLLAAAGVPERFAQRAMRYAKLLPKYDTVSHLPAPRKLLEEHATEKGPQHADRLRLSESMFHAALFLAVTRNGDHGEQWRLPLWGVNGWYVHELPGNFAIRYWTRSPETARYIDDRWRQFKALYGLHRAVHVAYHAGEFRFMHQTQDALDSRLSELVQGDPDRDTALAFAFEGGAS